MVSLRLKSFFDYAHLERTYYKDVSWPQAPRVGEHVVVGAEEGGGRLVAEVDMVLWREDGSADVYLDLGNSREACAALLEDGWLEQDPDPAIAT